MYKINEDLKLVKINNVKTKVFFALSILLNVVLISHLVFGEPEIEVVSKTIFMQDSQVVEKDIPLTDSALTEALAHYGCVLPAVAVAQAKIESANYSSNIAKENKNLFGIKYHKCKYVKGEHRGHASYDSYRNNILCYIHVQNHYLKNIDGVYAAPGQYVSIIKNQR